MDIFKLIKTLNSAQSSWQISLAIVLAMISGFLPLSTPLNFLLLFIAFAINIPLGLFFVFTALFSGLGLLLDPVFATLGYSVLTADSLNATFTAMFNYTPTLWTSYNYTILMGSLVISLPLALTALPILNRLIDKYRNVLEAKFKNSKYFSWLNPYSEEKLSKKPGFMRWWAAALFIAIVALISTILLLVLDPLIKVALEYSLSKVSQRTVQIDSVDSNILEAKLHISNISFLDNADKSSSDINVDALTLKLNTQHLLQKKLDFEVISFGNITLNSSITKRVQAKEDKEATSKGATSTNSSKDENSFDTPQLPNIDELIAKEGLKSVVAAKEIQKNITAITKKWSDFAQGDGQKKKIDSIQKKIKSLEKKANNIKSPEQILSIVNEADTLKGELESVQKELTSMSKEYEKDQATISKHLKEIQTLPMQDYKHLASKYSLDQNGAMNIIGTHFSSSLEKYLRMATKYYEKVKPYISSEEDETTPEQVRMRGKWIKYTSQKPYPDFVIRKLEANIIMSKNNYDLKVKDISDDQKLYKKPLIGSLESKSEDYKLVLLNFEHNELAAEVLTTLDAKVNAYKLDKYSVSKNFSIKESLIDGKSRVKVTDFENIQADISANFIKTSLLYSGNSKTQEIVAGVLANITSFSVDSSIGGTLQNPQISLKSDLDKKIAKALKAQVGKEVKKYKKELQEAITKEFNKELENLDLGEFEDVKKLLNADAKDTNALENILRDKMSQDALQKQLGSGSIDNIIKNFKLF